MKVRSYGALMGALLTISAVETAQAASGDNAPKPAQHAIPRHAPARTIHRDAGAEYAQSYYDYRSASRVTEEFVRRAPVPAPVAVARPAARDGVRDDGFRVAPNDAHIRFYHDDRVVYGPGVSYAPPVYYPAPAAYYPPPSPHYPPPAPYYPPQDGLQLDQQGWGGGVGASEAGGGGGGGGYGGQAFLYMNQGGASDEPSNQGGVDVPPGYGPTYRGVWQGPTVPTRGGLSTGTSSGSGH